MKAFFSLVELQVLLFCCFAVFSPQARAQEKMPPQKILVSVKPLALILQSIKREEDVVEVLVTDGASNHDFQLKPSDIKKIAEADLLIWSGAEYEPYLAKSLTSKSRHLNVMALDTLAYIDLADVSTKHGSHDHHQTHGSRDVHIWFDSNNAIELAKAMAAAAHYPEESTRELERRLKAFEAETNRNDINKTAASLIVYHDGYRYLERQLGLKHDFVINPDHQLSFGLKHWQAFMQQLEADIKANKRSCIITQAGFEKGPLAAKLANRKNIRFVEIDPLAANKDYPDYFSFWLESQDKLKSCFNEE